MIIFDLDDTLIDTTGSITPIKLERTIHALSENGLFIDNFDDALKFFLKINKTVESSKEALKKFLEKLGADKKYLSIGIKEIYSGTLEGIDIKPLKDAPEILKKLSKRHDLALVSIGIREIQMEKLRKGGIDPALFKEITIISEKNKKSSYRDALMHFHVKAKSVIVCGDRITLDLLPGRELGFKTIHMRWGRGLNSQDIFDAVDYTVHSFKEFEKLIKHIEGEK